jgi:hypothetical protein
VQAIPFESETGPPAGEDLLYLKRKKARQVGPFSLILAERTGLEPATPGVTGRYSNQLNYRSRTGALDVD